MRTFVAISAKWRFGLRLAFSLALLTLVLSRISLGGVAAKFSGFTPPALVGALLCQLASNLLAATRWRVVMSKARSPRQPPGFFLRSFFRASFINQCLPTIIGGDALRVAELAQRKVSYREALGGVAIDRLMGLCGLMLLNVIMLPTAADIFPRAMLWTIALASTGAIGAVGIGLVLPLDRWLSQSPRFAVIAETVAYARRLLFNLHGLVVQVTLSLSIHFFSILAIFLLARDLGLQLPLAVFLVILPSVILLTTLPVSISGWGVREGSMVALFALAGGDASEIFAASVCYGVVFFVSTLPGLWFLVIGQRKVGALQ